MLLIGRLVEIQLLDRENLRVRANKQFRFEVKLDAERGRIFDRNMNYLAFNIPKVRVVAYPKLIPDINTVSVRLSRIFNIEASFFRKRLQTKKDLVYLLRGQPDHVRQQVADLKTEGLKCQTEMARIYPKGHLASHVLGFTDLDGAGLSGLELSMDMVLRGVPGTATLQRTAQSEVFVRSEYPTVPPANGQDLVLTLDAEIQDIAERELHRTVLETDAESGVAIVMNPKTGQVLSLAMDPYFDPNNAGNYPAASWRIRALTDQIEPGSTFKVVLMSAILQESVKRPDEIIFCENGKYSIMGETIHDTSPHAWLTLREVFSKSSNIGMAKTTLELDKAKIFNYAKLYGFGSKTGIELRGEIDGILRQPKDWSGFTPVAMAIGHEIAATPIQLAAMFCTVANNGYYIRPTIVKHILKDGVITKTSTPVTLRRILTPETADILKHFMHEAVENGTGQKAKIDGLQVCGKTGTARMIYTDRRGYIPNKYVASFGGFFPMNDPEYCIFVMVVDPKNLYYGGDVAAPCFSRIAKQIVMLNGYDREYLKKQLYPKQEEDATFAPSFVGLRKSVAAKLAERNALTLFKNGKGEVVITQEPKPGHVLTRKDSLKITLKQATTAESAKIVVPNVKGLTLRQALNRLHAEGIQGLVTGSGTVVWQEPQAGQALNPGQKVRLRCETPTVIKDMVSLN